MESGVPSTGIHGAASSTAALSLTPGSGRYGGDGTAAAALRCSWQGPEGARARRLRARVAYAARSGFRPQLLGVALQDAQHLLDLWRDHLPAHKLESYIWGQRLPAGTEVFFRQLWPHQEFRDGFVAPPRASDDSYCLYAHVLAVFVVARMKPIHFFAQEKKRGGALAGRGGGGAASSVSRQLPLLVRRWRRLRLPEEIPRFGRTLLTRALLLYARDRVTDQARLAGWPVGAGELAELFQVFRHPCKHHWRCTFGDFEHRVNSRLGRARRLGGFRPVTMEGDWWDEAWRGAVWPWEGPFSALVGHAGAPADAAVEPMRQLWAVAVGTHAAFFREVRSSLQAATTKAFLRGFELKFDILAMGDKLYDGNASASLNASSQSNDAPAIRDYFYSIIHHNYLMPASLSDFVLRGARAHANDGIFFICTIPAVLCAAFASAVSPVILYSPTGVTVQIPMDSHEPFLRLMLDMARDPKNHFIASNPATRAQFEYHTGFRMPVIPVMAHYITEEYSGWDSSAILVHDRTSSVFLLRALQLLAPPEFALRFVGFLDTDRQYGTFASHRALVYVPGCIPEQMFFYEVYAMGLPILLPADSKYYLYPSLDISHGLFDGKAFAEWVGKHRLFLDLGPTLDMYANYTIRPDGRVFSRVVLRHYDKGGSFTHSSHGAEHARLVPLRAMDEFGNTHALMPEGSRNFMTSHLGCCVRAAIWHSWGLSITMGPSPPYCPMAGALGSCASGGPLARSMRLGSSWVLSQRHAPMIEIARGGMSGRKHPVIFERHSFGATQWFHGARTISRRRRGATSPFDFSTHYGLRQWVKMSDMFTFPEVRHFVSMADVVRQLSDLKPAETAARMKRFVQERRATGLAAWRATLEAVAWHPSQP